MLNKIFSVLTLILVVGALGFIGHLWAAFFTITGLMIFALPGILLVLYLSKHEGSEYSVEDSLFIGSVLGLGLSCTLASLISYFLGFNPLYITLGLISLSLLLLGSLKIGKPFKTSYDKRRSIELNLILVFLILITLALLIPYRSFGEATDKGIAFNSLYKTDLMHHMTTAIELTKGIPPLNPYFSGEYLHYHWLSHVFPAFVYAFSGYSVSPRDIIVSTALLYSLLFVGSLFVTLREYYSDTKVLLFLMVVSLLAYGYNDLFVFARSLLAVLPDTLMTQTIWHRFFIDESGQQYTGYSHSWFRSFFVEPHVTLTLSMLLAMINVSKKHGFFPDRKRVAIIQGILMGCAIAMNAFIGLLFALSYGLFGTYRYLTNKFEMETLKSIVMAMSGVVSFLGFMFFFKMVQPGYHSLVIKPYASMLVLSPVYLFIDFGPVIILGTVGWALVVKKWNKADDSIVFFTILAMASLFFMFFVRYSDIGSQVIRMGGMTFRFCLVVFAGISIQQILQRYGQKSTILGITIASILMALPTPLVDIYRISTFDKPSEETFYIAPQDVRAYQWIKKNLPEDAVVQDMPTGITGLAALAERRTVLGDWQHAMDYQIGTPRVAERHNDIYRTLFQGNDVNSALYVIREYGIQYVYVGPEARKKCNSDALEKFEQFPEYFKKIYLDQEVVIYKVADAQSKYG